MAYSPTPRPPLRLPDGTLVPVGNEPTYNWQADGTSFQAPSRQGASRYLADRSLDAGAGFDAADRFGTTLAARTTAIADRSQSGALTTAPPLAAGFKERAGALATGAGSVLMGGARAVGGAVAKDPMGALNLALGVAGAVSYATAKAPKMIAAPDPYAPMIRPAQGLNSASLEAGRRGIQSAQTQAGRATGADTGTTGVTRLLAQQQAGEQQGMLSIKDNEAFQQDQRRVDQETNQAYDRNYQAQRGYQQQVFDLNQKAFDGRRQTSAAMSQAALTYFTQNRASNREYVARAAESKLYAAAGLVRGGGRSRSGSSTGSASNSDYDDDSQPARRAQGGKLPVAPNELVDLLRRGGRIGDLMSLSGRRAARDSFNERLDRYSLQARRAFDQTLRDVANRKGGRSK